MKAVKGNKVYTIDESSKARYIAMGYDITKDEKVIAYGKGKTVAYDKYVAVVKENEALKAELEDLKQKVSSADEVDKKATSNTDKTEKKTTNKSAKE